MRSGKIIMNRHIVAFVILLLAGCGGGGSSGGVEQQSAAGIWEGTGITTGSISGNVIGFIASNGAAFFVTDLPAIVYGTASVSGSNFSFNGTNYDGSAPMSVTMSGTVTTDTSLSVSYTSPDETGTISLSKASVAVGVYDRSSNLSKLVGVWNDAVTDSVGDWTFTIQSSGQFSGIRVTDNCTMNGTFSTINPSKNEYAVSSAITLCGSSNGNYSGLAFTSDANSLTDNVISFVIANAQDGGIFEATRQ